MTSKDLERLNRNNRIIERAQRGEAHGLIAAAEGVSTKTVSNVTRRAGLKVDPEQHREHCTTAYYRDHPMEAFMKRPNG